MENISLDSRLYEKVHWSRVQWVLELFERNCKISTANSRFGYDYIAFWIIMLITVTQSFLQNWRKCATLPPNNFAFSVYAPHTWTVKKYNEEKIMRNKMPQAKSTRHLKCNTNCSPSFSIRVTEWQTQKGCITGGGKKIINWSISKDTHPILAPNEVPK